MTAHKNLDIMNNAIKESIDKREEAQFSTDPHEANLERKIRDIGKRVQSEGIESDA